MDIKEKKNILTEVTVKTICDKCGKEIQNDSDYVLYGNNISISYRYSAWGDSWISWGFKLEDLCLDCCKELYLLLKNNGFKLIETGEDD